MTRGEDMENYVKVKVVLQQLRPFSIMLTKSRNHTLWQTCPRSCLHGGSDLILQRMQHECPADIEIKMLRWKARELGL